MSVCDSDSSSSEAETKAMKGANVCFAGKQSSTETVKAIRAAGGVVSQVRPTSAVASLVQIESSGF
jgi:hypothetical protein